MDTKGHRAAGEKSPYDQKLDCGIFMSQSFCIYAPCFEGVRPLLTCGKDGLCIDVSMLYRHISGILEQVTHQKKEQLFYEDP